ncbi:MAG: c-type cytochrome, partial [Bradyrhizobiaceae bacterium]|nr:c-type cytochrome [Bradyrhizobiaceae bacterium]
MAGRAQVGFAAVALMLLPMTYAAGPGLAQPADPDAAPSRQAGVGHNYLQVPLGNIAPGATPAEPELENPMANDPASAQRGMQYFNGFNCVGCHAPNGGGGMGPSLTSRNFKFGNAPAQHFMVIAHGAPFGMPAWAGQLPENVI